MRYLSVCSGIEAATQAWHPLGWEPVAFSEIERFPRSVLEHRLGARDARLSGCTDGVPLWGDFTAIRPRFFRRLGIDTSFDVLVGGTPCQSFSVAGLRKGMDDPRGALALRFLVLARQFRPRWVVWENVPGVLSADGGRAFGSFLGGLAELGYGFAYRVLDAQYVRVESHARAVPQRRRRVFVVGHLGDWRRAAAVLFERESLSGHPPPRREAGEGATPLLEVGARTSGDGYRDGDGIGRTGDPMYSLQASKQHGVAITGERYGNVGGADTTQAGREDCHGSAADPKDHGGAGLRPDGEGHPLVPRFLQGLSNARSVALRGRGGGGTAELGDCVGEALRASQGGGDKPHVLVAHSLRAEGVDASEGGTGRGTPLTPDVSPAIKARDAKGPSSDGGGGGGQVLCHPMAVRRLTPRECERLQGFPDGYTRIPWRGKDPEDCPDGHRYRALGNSMAVNVMRWLGERVQMVEELTP